MKKTYLLLLISATICISFACKKKRGCMDSQAVNYNIEAEADCDCCQFEKVVFYSRYPSYNIGGVWYSILSYPLKVYVNNREIGTISAFYPGGPGTGTVPGVVTFEPGDNKKVEWYAKVTAQNGNFIILGSGTFNAGKQPIAIPVF